MALIAKYKLSLLHTRSALLRSTLRILPLITMAPFKTEEWRALYWISASQEGTCLA